MAKKKLHTMIIFSIIQALVLPSPFFFLQDGETRIDRIFYVSRPVMLVPQTIQLLDEPVQIQNQPIFPSDHFGLKCRFKYSSN